MWFCLTSIGLIVTLIIIVSLWEKFQTNPTITGKVVRLTITIITTSIILRRSALFDIGIQNLNTILGLYLYTVMLANIRKSILCFFLVTYIGKKMDIFDNLSVYYF